MTATTHAVTHDDAVAHFLRRLSARGMARNTLIAYEGDLQQFIAYLRDRGEPTLVALTSQRAVAGWLDKLAVRGLRAVSTRRKLSTLRRYIGHCITEGWLQHDPTAGESVKVKAKRRIAPEMVELSKVLTATAKAGDRFARRDAAIIRLLMDAGIRAGALCALDVPGVGSQSTVDLDRLLLHIDNKGGDVRTVGIGQGTADALRDWLRVRGNFAGDDCVALFVSSRRARLHRGSLERIVKQRGEAAGVQGLGPHLIRHRRIQDVYDRCGKEAAQHHACHASGSTTEQIYGAHADSVSRQMIRDRADLDQTLRQARAGGAA